MTPDSVLQAYGGFFASFHSTDQTDLPDSCDEVGAYPGGTLYRVADGWGEVYIADPDSGDAHVVASKMPDVGAYDVAERYRGKIDVKQLGMGNSAWDRAALTALGGETMDTTEKTWTAKRIGELPDSAFAYIEPGGTKDESGRTFPRGLRHLAYRDEAGDVDVDRLKAAIAAVPGTALPKLTQEKVAARLEKVLKSVEPDAETRRRPIGDTTPGGWPMFGDATWKAWTDEARAAALEARRRRMGTTLDASRGSTAGQGKKTATATAARSHGYKGGNWANPNLLKHPDGHQVRLNEDGSWTHTTAPFSHAVMVNGGFHDSYGTKEEAAAAAANLRDKGNKATVAKIPAELREESMATEGRNPKSLTSHLSSLHGSPKRKDAEGDAPAISELEQKYEEFRQQVADAAKAAAGPGSRVQSLHFGADQFKSAEEAQAWANDHGFAAEAVTRTGAGFSIEQADAGAYENIHAVNLTAGVSASVGYEKAAAEIVGQAWLLTSSGRLAFKSAQLATAEAEPVEESDGVTVWRVKCAGASTYFAEADGYVLEQPHYELLSKAARLVAKQEFVPIIKNEEQRFTLSVVYPCSKAGEPEPDFHGDVMTAIELEKSAWQYMSKGTDRIGLMHRPGTTGAGRVVESYIWRGPEWKLEKDAGGLPQSVSPGDWVMGIIWNEDVWPTVKSGQMRGVSLQGAARKEAFAG